jgi:glutathione peroxidase
MANVYDFSLNDKKGNEVSLSQYKGKVLLIVNSATECGFTPQYEELEALYKKLRGEGLEILDIPCNQFGGQAPGTDEQISEFCSLKFGTEFPQFKKADVNGEHELPLYTWLKSEKTFEGFDMEHKIAPILVDMFDKSGKDWRNSSDIKWNFTKFLIDREGNVVARFEPTKDMKKVEEEIRKLL